MSVDFGDRAPDFFVCLLCLLLLVENFRHMQILGCPFSYHPGSTIINSRSKLFSTLLPDTTQLQLTTFFKQTLYHFTFRYSICISKRAPFQNVTIPFSHLKITAKILKITKHPVKFSYFPNGLIFHHFNQDPNKSTNCTGRYTIWQV